MERNKSETLTAVGLFAGIGGIELGLSRAGHRAQMICEIDPGAAEVLRQRFGMSVEPDIRKLSAFPKVDLIAAGFPCQDLSQAGRTAGIGGHQSGLIGEVFKRLRSRANGPAGCCLRTFRSCCNCSVARRCGTSSTSSRNSGSPGRIALSTRGRSAFRNVGNGSCLLASRSEDPRSALFGCDAGEESPEFSQTQLCGFYWTEGLRGLGWAVDAVPTLKGGSTIGIPSPPAIWDPQDGSITTPDIRDAERLQGFDEGWTAPAAEVPGVRQSHRWKLVGNAVSVPVAEWIGRRLIHPTGDAPEGIQLQRGVAWPRAAWGHKGHVYSVDVSSFPERKQAPSLREFLRFPRTPLSHRAASGFLSRALVSGLRFEDGFLKMSDVT